MKIGATLTLPLIIGYHLSAWCQITVQGKITDIKSKLPLSYVNIGISAKNVGAISEDNGSFSITIPQDNLTDTLTFSLVGYYEFKVPIIKIEAENQLNISLTEKSTTLSEVVIQGEKFVEKKYGIKKTGIIHFTDGIFKKDDSFEIGQVINLGSKTIKLTSVNLHINSSRTDSANFRINFYKYDENANHPTSRLYERSIIQRHPIREGWLKFNLSDYNIRLKGKVFAAIKFIPERKDVKQIFYEIKIGGSSKSFFRKSSLGQWVRAPHHYCLFVTALVDKKAPDEPDDVETLPAIVLQSDFSDEPYSLFVRLPKDYSKATHKTYPVIFHLDGNAFFDPIAASVEQLIKKKDLEVDPIIVGIGYKNAYVMDSLRSRDYTFPASLPADSFGVSGEGAKFYNFIKTKVIPRVDSVYRTDPTKRMIMGHSLGGYFVLYSLLRDTEGRAIFNSYVAASPSLQYRNNYLVKQFENNYPLLEDQKRKLYLTIGELEGGDKDSNTFENLFDVLTLKNFLQLQVKTYMGLEHMGTAIPSFEDGIKFGLSK